MEMPQAMRQKYWNELTADEKIERLRDVVRNLSAENVLLREQNHKLNQHEHMNGILVMPINGLSFRQTTPEKSDDSYI